MAKIESNIKRVRKSVQDEQGRYSVRTREMARKIAAQGRDNVRANIKAKPAGVFPGYAISGALARKVVASEPKKSRQGWTATVRVLTTGKQRLYALIHEVGGTIKAKGSGYLHFKVQGQWVRVKSVRIRAKRYFAKGIEKTRRTVNLERSF